MNEPMFSFEIIPSVISAWKSFFEHKQFFESLQCNTIMFSHPSVFSIYPSSESTIISFDYGVSKEDKLFYFGIGQAF